MSETYADKVAASSGRKLDEVLAVLARHNIVDSPTPPIAKSLRLKKLAFSGHKNILGDVQPFSFHWAPNELGVNVIATDSNFAGKSSVLQVMLWALRGEPKSLTTTVQGWLEHVHAEFLAGERHVRVVFEVNGGKPHGNIDLLNQDGSIIHSLAFASPESFKAQMNSVMLDALHLEPIATSREIASQEKTVMYSDGWAAYTGALLFDSDSTALIGDTVGTDHAQRLLQVFLGIPWATTLFQARAAKRVADSLVQARKRKLAQFGNRTVGQMEERLAEIARLIASGQARETALAELEKVRKAFTGLEYQVTSLKVATTVVNAEVAAGQEELLTKKRELLAIEEEAAATRFLGRLSPTCCPRCTQAFSAARQKNERTTGACAVCLTQVEEGIAIDYEALKTNLTKAIAKLTRDLKAVTQKAGELNQSFEKSRKDLDETAFILARLSASGTALEEQKLQLEAARLQGTIEAIKTLVQADGGEEDELVILSHATEVAKTEVENAAKEMLERSGELIKDLLVRLGMRDVEQVVLKRNANVEIHKGGSESTFGKLAAGERLRVRIATVIALLQASQQFGAGRHPGLLIIDSPAKEEMADANIEEMLAALSELAADVNLQLFMAFRGTARALQHFPEERCLLAAAGKTLW